MAKKHTIDRVDFNFQVWGINSNMEDYRLCWHFNDVLHWQMKRIHDVRFYSPRAKQQLNFSAYKFQHRIDRYTAELLQNRNGGHFLIPEMKNFDFLFLLQGEDDYFDAETFFGRLTAIPGIQTVIPVAVQSLQSRANLLFRHFNDNDQKKDQDHSHHRAGE